jgi:hypothetical protein
VPIHGAPAEEERGGNLLVRLVLGHLPQDVTLPTCQPTSRRRVDPCFPGSWRI